jgi:hypothetical protein
MWFTLSKLHAAAIVSYLSGRSEDEMCQKQRYQCDGASEECCFIRVLQEVGLMSEVQDSCDMFLWWRDNEGALADQKAADLCDGTIGTPPVSYPCTAPVYCNHTLYSRAAGPLVKENDMHSFAFEHPTMFENTTEESLRALVASPFLYARKFEASAELVRLLASLLEL